ncbi:transcriptional repressor [Massilia sp. BKSP1R2A-1]|uniref:transcriptional repressor n=1 Tax=Massilia sp. BKSP1R2A-1 TaxID=3422595 RepID=UPI003D3553A5
MKRRLYGIVFAFPQDEEYNGMAHLWTRDAETAYWFSLTRAVDSDDIEVMVSGQLNYVGPDLSVILSSTEIVIKVSAAAARALDGYSEYAVAFHPESQDLCSIRETLEVIFGGKVGLVIDT